MAIEIGGCRSARPPWLRGASGQRRTANASQGRSKPSGNSLRAPRGSQEEAATQVLLTYVARSMEFVGGQNMVARIHLRPSMACMDDATAGPP